MRDEQCGRRGEEPSPRLLLLQEKMANDDDSDGSISWEDFIGE